MQQRDQKALVESKLCDQARRKNDSLFSLSATLPICAIEYAVVQCQSAFCSLCYNTVM